MMRRNLLNITVIFKCAELHVEAKLHHFHKRKFWKSINMEHLTASGF